MPALHTDEYMDAKYNWSVIAENGRETFWFQSSATVSEGQVGFKFIYPFTVSAIKLSLPQTSVKIHEIEVFGPGKIGPTKST